MGQLLSLKARALAWLAQREHSRSELRRKLLRAARAQAARAPADEPGSAADADPAIAIEQLLDALQGHGLLSDERFVESRVRVRSANHGTRRIEFELAQHGLKLGPAQLQQMRDSELQRARLLWQRRFGALPVEAADRARQARFLAGRGFAAAVVRRVLRAPADRESDDTD